MTFMPRVGMSQYFANEHLAAAKFMAESCAQREQECKQVGITGVDVAARSYALSAIVLSIAFLEAVLNEFLRDAKRFGKDSPYLNGYEQDALNLLLSLLKDSRIERSQSTLDKYDLTLLCAGKAKLDRGRSPGQDVVALVRARNALVHFEPEIHWEDEVHDLEKAIGKRVAPNPLMVGMGPWFPHHLLCSSVAQWAWESSVAVAEEWRQSLGLELDYTRRGAPRCWTLAQPEPAAE